MGVIKDLDKKYDKRKNKKSVILNKHRTILSQIREYLKKNNIDKAPHLLKKDVLIQKFLFSLPLASEYLLIAEPKNRMLLIFDLYEQGIYDFLKPQGNRVYENPSLWKDLCIQVYKTYGKKCLCCGTQENISVDHIKPFSRFKELALVFDNLQPLCKTCNSSKGNKRYTDYRKK